MQARENWNSRIGVILAVAGSAVGLGNFLRFPGQAAQYGGGAFMIAYFCALLLLGLPICWAEWTMGRRGGDLGYNSFPAIFAAITRNRAIMWLGVLGVVVPVVIYMYYVYVEAWCLGYSVNFLLGGMRFQTVEEAGRFWGDFIGIAENGSAIHFGLHSVGLYLVVVFLINFVLIYRGVAKGIEWFCKFALPFLILLGFVVLLRVLTLSPDPAHPERTVSNGLGFMWNPGICAVQQREPESGFWKTIREIIDPEVYRHPEKVVLPEDQRLVRVPLWQQLRNPQLWLAAAGQIFFSLSVGFGVILNYSSYLRKRDDVLLSGLTATSANEFCEVALGGMITLPAAYMFIGAAGLAGAISSSFTLGFKVLPMVFANMPLGQWFGFLFFFLLFLAAVTSSISMLQPAIAFLEESLQLKRHASVAILGLLTFFGTSFVWYFSKDLKALDTLDFWAGTFCIYILATIQAVVFAWVMDLEENWKLAHEGAAIRIPDGYKWIMKYITPIYLMVVFLFWFLVNVLGLGRSQSASYITDLFGPAPDQVAWMSVALILLTVIFVGLVIFSSPLYQKILSVPKDKP